MIKTENLYRISFAYARLLFVCLLLVGSSFKGFAETENSTHFEQALSAYNDGDLETSYIHLKNSLQQQPRNLPAKILIGKVLLESGYTLESEMELLEALELGGDPSLIAKTLATALLLQQEYEDVNDLNFAKLTPKARTDLDVIKATARMLNDQPLMANEMLNRVIASNPNNHEALDLLADLEIQKGDLTKAQNYIDRATTLNPNSTTSIRIQGEIFEKQNNFVDAEKTYFAGLEINPSDPILQRNLAALLVRMEKFERAQELVNQILTGAPNDPMGTLLNSWILVQKNRPDDAMLALDSLSNAISTLPPNITAASPDFVFIQGLAFFARGEYESARNFFSEFVQLSKHPEEAIVFLVDVHMKLGESSNAIELLEKYPKTIEENLDLASIAVDAYLQTNKLHRAISLVDALQTRYPDSSLVPLLSARVLEFRGRKAEALAILSNERLINSEAYTLARAQLYLNANQYAEAITEIDALFVLQPKSADYRNLKAAALIKLQRFDQAEKFARESLAIDPEHFSAKFNLATILAAKQDVDTAEAMLIKLLELSPDHQDSVVLLAKIEANTERPAKGINRLNEYVVKFPSAILARETHIDMLIRAQRFKQAQRELNQLVRRTELDGNNSLKKAQIHIGLNEFENARLELAKLSTLWQEDATKLYELSLRQSGIRDYPGAIDSLNIAAELSPTSRLISQQLIRNHLAVNQPDIAEQLLRQLVQRSQETANTLMLRGDIARVRKDLVSAYRFYKQALMEDTSFNQVLAKMYFVSAQLSNQTDFAETVEKLIATQPELLFHRNLLADYYLESADFDSAEMHLRVLSRYEDFGNRALVLNNLANILLNRADISEAVTLSETAYALNPDVAAIVDTYAWALAKDEKYEQALKLLRRAYAMDSADPSIHYHLGYTLIKLGNLAEGKAQLETALASAENFIGRLEAESLLSTTN